MPEFKIDTNVAKGKLACTVRKICQMLLRFASANVKLCNFTPRRLGCLELHTWIPWYCCCKHAVCTKGSKDPFNHILYVYVYLLRHNSLQCTLFYSQHTVHGN